MHLERNEATLTHGRICLSGAPARSSSNFLYGISTSPASKTRKTHGRSWELSLLVSGSSLFHVVSCPLRPRKGRLSYSEDTAEMTRRFLDLKIRATGSADLAVAIRSHLPKLSTAWPSSRRPALMTDSASDVHYRIRRFAACTRCRWPFLHH